MASPTKYQAPYFFRSPFAFNRFLLPSISSKSLRRTSFIMSLCCCMVFHFYPFVIILVCSSRYSHLPKSGLCGTGAAGYSGDDAGNEQISADTHCRISHAEISIPNPPPRIGRASEVMGYAGEFFGSTPLHDPQDAASILQNYHLAVFCKGYPASRSIICILESQENRIHCLVHKSCML